MDFLVRVPNQIAGTLDFRELLGWVDAPGIFTFSLSTLDAMLKKSGFMPKEWSCGIGAYTTFLLSLRFWIKSRKKTSKALVFCLNPYIIQLLACWRLRCFT
jgi:hypothetical protein